MPIHDWTRVYAGLFHDFHQSWTIYIKNAINAGLLPRGLTALVEQKTGPKEPNVLTVDSLADSRNLDEPEGGLLTATPPATRIVRKSSKEFYSDLANRIVVKHKLGRTIAVIEIVLPGNKDSKRAFEFIDKSQDFLRGGVHLLVVDLFPPTKRDPFGIHRAIWDEFEDEDEQFEFPPGKDRILASYDASRELGAYVEPIGVGDAMPDMPLFLFESRHIKVPLEAAYQTAWSLMPRDLQVLVETGVMPGVAEG
jgi:hypothetical protein